MTLHPTVEDVMLDPAHFQSAGLIDDQVPDRFGLYAIRTRDLAALTDPYRAIAEERCSDLIYLGEATGQTLRRWFLRNRAPRPRARHLLPEPRSRAWLPPARWVAAGEGEPAELPLLTGGRDGHRGVDQYEPRGLVVAFDEGVHNAEVAMIQKHTPLLNLRDNPGALPELSALRALCCQIAVTPAI
jgi:hypothetical protein